MQISVRENNDYNRRDVVFIVWSEDYFDEQDAWAIQRRHGFPIDKYGFHLFSLTAVAGLYKASWICDGKKQGR